MPDAFIGIDLIVGARGETEEEFLRSLEFVRSLPITRLHVFPYSERPGTKALEIDHIVSQQEKHRRTNTMLRFSEERAGEYARRFIGTVRPVLIETARMTKVWRQVTPTTISKCDSHPTVRHQTASWMWNCWKSATTTAKTH